MTDGLGSLIVTVWVGVFHHVLLAANATEPTRSLGPGATQLLQRRRKASSVSVRQTKREEEGGTSTSHLSW
jgi:hypothetical protein